MHPNFEDTRRTGAVCQILGFGASEIPVAQWPGNLKGFLRINQMISGAYNIVSVQVVLLDLFREIRGYACLMFVGQASGSCLRMHLSLRDLQQMWRDLSGAPCISLYRRNLSCRICPALLRDLVTPKDTLALQQSLIISNSDVVPKWGSFGRDVNLPMTTRRPLTDLLSCRLSLIIYRCR